MDHKLKTEYYCCKHKASGGAYIQQRQRPAVSS